MSQYCLKAARLRPNPHDRRMLPSCLPQMAPETTATLSAPASVKARIVNNSNRSRAVTTPGYAGAGYRPPL